MAEEEQQEEPIEDDIELAERENDSRTPTMAKSRALNDEEYVDNQVRINEWSLDGIVATLGTLVRVSLNFLEYGQRYFGLIRRWVPVDFYYLRVGEEEAYEQEPIYERDGEDKRIPLQDANKRIVRDENGDVQYKIKEMSIGYRYVTREKWISPNDLLKTCLFRWSLKKKLVRTSNKEADAYNEEDLEPKDRKWISLLRQAILADDKEKNDKKKQLNIRRKWFLCRSQSERNIQNPREGGTKIPKKYLNCIIRWLKRLQEKNPDLIVTDIYGGKDPARLALDTDGNPINFLVEGKPGYGKPGMRLGDMNIAELSKLAVYWATPKFYDARKRWYWFRKIKAELIVGFYHKYDKLPLSDELDEMVEDAYDWWYLYHQVDFVKTAMTTKLRFDTEPNKSVIRISPSDRAEARFNAVNLLSHIVRYPVPSGSDTIDEDDALIYIPTSEEMLDFGRMTGAYQQGKAAIWRYQMFAFNDAALNAALGRDWAGARSSGKWGGVEGVIPGVYGGDWRFMVIYNHLESVKDTMESKEWRKLRRELLGPIASRNLTSAMPAEGALMGDFGGRRVDITDGARQLRGQIALGREGSIIRWPKVLEEVLPRLRRQRRGEIGMLYQETIWWRDSLHIADDEKGFTADNMSQGLQVRLDSIYSDEEGQPLIEIVDLNQLQRGCVDSAEREKMRKDMMPDDYTPSEKPVKIDFFNQGDIMRQLWLKQPFDQARNHILDELRSHLRNNVPHVRPKMVRMFEGLPPKFNPLIRTIWQFSDIRVKRVLVTVKSHGAGAARGFGFGDAGSLVSDAYGLGYGSKRDQQRRVLNLYELALWNKYGDSIRGYVEAYVVAHDTWEDYDAFRKMVGGDLRSRKLNLKALRMALTGLKMFGVVPAEWLVKVETDEKSLKKIKEMENWYSLMEAKLLSDFHLIDAEGKPVTRKREVGGEIVDWPVYGLDGEIFIDMIEDEGILERTGLETELLYDMHKLDCDRPKATALLVADPEEDGIDEGERESRRTNRQWSQYEFEKLLHEESA